MLHIGKSVIFKNDDTKNKVHLIQFDTIIAVVFLAVSIIILHGR